MNQRAKDGIKQFLEALSVDTEAPELEQNYIVNYSAV